MSEAKPKSWRDVYKVHPAVDVFPMLSEEELRKLGEDIQKNGLRETITVYRAKDIGTVYLVDGRNRLAAMELVGMRNATVAWLEDSDPSPENYIISKNIRRRHLTKEQQADLIVKVMKVSIDL